MKTFDFTTIDKTLAKNVKSLLKSLNISTDKIGLCGQEGSFKMAEIAAVKIMESVGIPFETCNHALNGVPPTGCDTEFGENWNWTKSYDGHLLLQAIKFADKFTRHEPFYEVGMKYPMFNPNVLIEKYNLNYIGTIETDFSKEHLEGDRKIFYDVWQSADKDYTFSFEKGRMGLGGYAGLVTKTITQSVDFCKWYLSNRRFYVKDFDLFFNGLGGLGISELKENKLI